MEKIPGAEEAVEVLKMLLNEVAFVLAGQVIAPLTWEFELTTVLDGLLQDVDAFSIGQSDKIRLHCGFKSLDERLVNHLVQECQIISTVV